MSLFGSQRDFKLFAGINRELLSDVMEQEILYYKISLADTQANIYGEALEKTFMAPVKLNCRIESQQGSTDDSEFGSDYNKLVDYYFLREQMVEANVVPEVGDIVMWHENYYEIDTVIENQFFVGRDNNYQLESRNDKFGASIGILCKTHMTRADRVGIAQIR
jgi:hypothetical protein